MREDSLVYPLAPWNLVRALKFLGLAWFLLGLAGAVVPSSRGTRMRAVYALVVPGFIATFGAGWLLMKLGGKSLSAPWILGGAGSGLCALHASFLVSHRAHPRPLTSMLTWGCATSAVAMMSVRAENGWLVPIGLLGLAMGALAARPFSGILPRGGPADLEIAWRGLRWVTWLEGVSLLVMLGIAMPLRRWLGISIDGNTGLLGWCHGMLVLVLLQSLASARGLFGWPRLELWVGLCASLVPGGCFWFERRLRALQIRVPEGNHP